MRVRWLVAAVIAFLAAAAPGMAADGPVPPCGTAPLPGYPAAGAPPHDAVWESGDLDGHWQPPSCTGWDGTDFTLLVALAGRFRFAGSRDALLARIGAISALMSVRYWSISDGRWNRLYDRAYALAGKDGSHPRGDFTAAELEHGGDFYFDQADNRTGANVVYRLRVRAAEPDHLRFDLDNVTAAKWLFIRVADPGDLQSMFVLDKASAREWTFYSLLRVRNAPPLATLFIRTGSYVNRAVALYRHIVGIPTDAEPPAVR
ncbi:MAG TPA: DUF6675 family protein [Stellaceae bacterium]|nr:DUF6675 family protein [Stellaceae bacterium]